MADHSLSNNVAGLSISSHSQQQLEAKCAFYESENQRMLADNSQLRYCLNDAEVKMAANGVEIEKLRKDQEDLLELLADQDTKMSEYRRRLRELGQQVEGSDDEDEDDDEKVAAGTATQVGSSQNGENRN
jgi:predicted nuclease with TOPRIM domain